METDTRVDIIVIGATGFTGKQVVKKLFQLTKEPEYEDLRWTIAGRSKDKMKDLLFEINDLGVKVPTAEVLTCDVTEEKSLKLTCRQARIIMNCTGPNIVLSEPIVKACIESKTHYVDISAELMHMLQIYRGYHKEAEDQKVLVVSACGFGSVPTLIGLAYLENNFQGNLHSVECYIELDVPKKALIPGINNCLVNSGTWECFVHEMQSYRRYRELYKITFPEPKPLPDDMKRSFFHKKEGKYWIPYPGPDHDIVEMTQHYELENRGKKPYHFKCYTTMPMLFHYFIVVPIFFVAYTLCYFDWFAWLLIKFPRFFSLGYFSEKGPTDEMRNDLKYSLIFKGRGSGKDADGSQPTKTMTLKVSSHDPYETTATAFIFSALTILKESDKMPQGGVITTGSAFRNTTMADKLHKNGIKFEIEDKIINQ